MTDNLNVKAGIAVDNGKMAAHAGHSDAKGVHPDYPQRRIC
jgi:hypothetical protein